MLPKRWGLAANRTRVSTTPVDISEPKGGSLPLAYQATRDYGGFNFLAISLTYGRSGPICLNMHQRTLDSIFVDPQLKPVVSTYEGLKIFIVFNELTVT